jgi:hypothetical protein
MDGGGEGRKVEALRRAAAGALDAFGDGKKVAWNGRERGGMASAGAPSGPTCSGTLSPRATGQTTWLAVYEIQYLACQRALLLGWWR